jgi:peptide/nickel transport system substrate-binding protein
MSNSPILPAPRALRRRASRRRFLGGGAAVIAGAAAAAACRGGGTGSPERGGTLRFGTSLPLGSGLDPHVEQGTGLTIFPKVYGYLWHVDPRDDSILLDHAETVEQPEPEVIVVHLRQGLRFHDAEPALGRPVLADDVVASLTRYRDSPIVAAKTWFTQVLDSLGAPDDRTLMIRLKRPYVYSLAELGSINAGAILPAEVAERALDIDATGAGSGPFAIERVERDGITRIVRFDAYAGDAALLDAMEWHVVHDDETKARGMRSLAFDVTAVRDHGEADRLGGFSPGIEIERQPALSSLSLGFRLDQPPYNDERVRRALDLLVDRGALIAQLTSGDADPVGPVNRHLAGGFWALPQEEVDAAQGRGESPEARRLAARQLLDAAGAADAVVRIQAPEIAELLDAARVVAQLLIDAGVAAEVEPLDQLRWYANERRGAFEATLIGHPPYETPDIPVRHYHSGGPNGDGSPFAFSDAAVDSLVERSWGEPDREARRGLLLQAQRRMIETRPLLPLLSGYSYGAAWRYVKGRRPDLAGSLAQYYYRYWLDLPVNGRPA